MLAASMAPASARIRYPKEPRDIIPGSGDPLSGYRALQLTLHKLAELADRVEATDPTARDVEAWCNAIVDGANSLTACFDAASATMESLGALRKGDGRLLGEIWFPGDFLGKSRPKSTSALNMPANSQVLASQRSTLVLCCNRQVESLFKAGEPEQARGLYQTVYLKAKT